uniref:Expressed conserved protein n=1 Tax=Caenorhabditis tropicalis TaxID=1561998 RepID=A0A1I7TF29_9PELO
MFVFIILIALFVSLSTSTSVVPQDKDQESYYRRATEFLPTMDEGQVHEALRRFCHPFRYICPKEQYAIGRPALHKWNMSAVMESETIKDLHAGKFNITNVAAAFMKEFCCLEEPCLSKCGIYRRGEAAIVKNFPENSYALLLINDKIINFYKKYIIRNLRKNGMSTDRKLYSEEIEELLAYLRNNDERLSAMVDKIEKEILRDDD